MEKEKKKKKVSVFTILIFVICGLLLIYSIVSIVSVTSYLKEMVDYNQLTVNMSSMGEIVTYYVTNCGTYLIYMFLFLAIWWTRQKPKEVVTSESSTDKEDDSKTDDNDEFELIEETKIKVTTPDKESNDGDNKIGIDNTVRPEKISSDIFNTDEPEEKK